MHRVLTVNDDHSPDNPSNPAAWPLMKIPAPESHAVLPFSPQRDPGYEAIDNEASLMQRIDFGKERHPVTRIIVLKLDHHGDFIIGLPALRALRQAFPTAHIRLICGKWNERAALECGLVDQVRCYNFFPERPHGVPVEPDALPIFDSAVQGSFDIAIDLRVDEDTRHLLGRVDAKLRCGIGSTLKLPLLDIALPHEHGPSRDANEWPQGVLFLPPGRFDTELPDKHPLHHSGPLVPGGVVHGPGVELLPGRLRVEVRLTVQHHIPGLHPAAIIIDVVRNGDEIVARKVVGRWSVFQLRHHPVALEFDNPGARSRFDFRIRVEGRPANGAVQFSGVAIHRLHGPPIARLRPAELHVGEKLSLLVTLIRERTADLYGPMAPCLTGETDPSQPNQPRNRPLRIAIAPFGNSEIRNWPVSHYRTLITLLLERLPCDVVLLGTPSQRTEASEITENLQSPDLFDLIGRTSWNQLNAILRSADLVICNNSGTAHLAAALGVKVLAIYSGSHQPREWGPRGRHAQAIMHKVPCSPCGFERLADCVADHACMRQITPAYVFSLAETMLAQDLVPAV